jgi:hypothetical protein
MNRAAFVAYLGKRRGNENPKIGASRKHIQDVASRVARIERLTGVDLDELMAAGGLPGALKSLEQVTAVGVKGKSELRHALRRYVEFWDSSHTRRQA